MECKHLNTIRGKRKSLTGDGNTVKLRCYCMVVGFPVMCSFDRSVCLSCTWRSLCLIVCLFGLWFSTSVMKKTCTFKPSQVRSALFFLREVCLGRKGCHRKKKKYRHAVRDWRTVHNADKWRHKEVTFTYMQRCRYRQVPQRSWFQTLFMSLGVQEIHWKSFYAYSGTSRLWTASPLLLNTKLNLSMFCFIYSGRMQ